MPISEKLAARLADLEKNLPGANFKGLESFVGNRAKAIANHEARLKTEISQNTGAHAYARHGHQTGWEGQLIRCCTNVSPDQRFDPHGVGGVIRSGTREGFGSDLLFSNQMGYNAWGEWVELPVGFAFEPGEADYQKMAGDVAGAFLGVEAQEQARTAALSAANSMSRYVAGQFQSKDKPDARITAPLTSVVVVVDKPKGGAPFGVGYRRTGTFQARTRDEVVRCIAALSSRASWAELYGDKVQAMGKAPVKDRPAFPNIAALLDHLGVEAFWEESAKGVLRRDWNPGTKTAGPWRVHTMFPTSGEKAGWATGVYLSDADKAKLKSNKLPKGNYAWTGGVGTRAAGPDFKLDWSKVDVPDWA